MTAYGLQIDSAADGDEIRRRAVHCLADCFGVVVQKLHRWE
jgi:hypothetical protein